MYYIIQVFSIFIDDWCLCYNNSSTLMIGKDYEFVFEDQIEFISTEVLKNTLKQKEESVMNNKGGVDEDDDDEEEGDGNMSVSMGKRDSNSSINIVKAKKETAHQKILAGSHNQYYSLVSPLLVLLSSLVSSFPLIVLLS